MIKCNTIKVTDGENFGGYSQRDRSLHCDHEVRGVQWVLADRLNRPFQQGQQVQVVPTCTDGNKMLGVETLHVEIILEFKMIFQFLLFQLYSLSVQKVQRVQ